MSESGLMAVILQAAKEKGLEKEVLIETLEDAMQSAAKKHFGQQRHIEAKFDPVAGIVELFHTVSVVENIGDLAEAVNQIPLQDALQRGMDVQVGDELVFQVFYRDADAEAAKAQDAQYGDILKLTTFRRSFGRIAAQTAKQVLLQKTREVERENVYREYTGRVGEIITGVCKRLEHGNLIVSLDRVEAVLPMREQIPRESYRAGDRVQAYVLDVLRESRGPQIILSRVVPDFVRKLFESEVPEMNEGIVFIEAVAREPGRRCKVAVSSKLADVDPVGACVGIRGSRIQPIIQELRGEKMDIVEYSSDPARFVYAALAPAEVSRVIVDESNRSMEIVVPDGQLSLAIGRHGQNVRLAVQLTGWKLDINSASRVEELRNLSRQSLGALPAVSEILMETLYAHGFRMAKDIVAASDALLAQVPGLDISLVPLLKEQASARLPADNALLEEFERQKEQQQLRDWKSHNPESLTDDQRMLLLRGVTTETVPALKAAGYKTVQSIAEETDLHKLANILGVNLRSAQQVRVSAERYVTMESKRVREGESSTASFEKESASSPAGTFST